MLVVFGHGLSHKGLQQFEAQFRSHLSQFGPLTILPLLLVHDIDAHGTRFRMPLVDQIRFVVARDAVFRQLVADVPVKIPVFAAPSPKGFAELKLLGVRSRQAVHAGTVHSPVAPVLRVFVQELKGIRLFRVKVVEIESCYGRRYGRVGMMEQ